ncbi:MAG: beta-lactamase family protein [Gemmatimonadetes bacterium]|jgi:CubicO group peptidase (beta-lactamase class C family)|nr:beta-lactamase family protein [Gemmatimonadota bacterium]MBT5055079.1 beta-lactamase family protein [Gemmatimonadota bacterium]MBT5141199.1 beta-lactamase family protein [Gemmatimonadota bacterium]MBT5588880.1 beta-lactamase family protein [Gemmatimonadota bacterium]MBT5961418.1 beta-lactamase family protein [Gemmatimonadota bacterium]
MAELGRLCSLLQTAIDVGSFRGVQLAMNLQGQDIDLCLGEASPGVEMTSQHLLPWLSAGKPLTAIAWAQLWEAGRIGLDDPVIEYVPEFGLRGKEAITFRHLLTHTAGFRSLVDVNAGSDWSQQLQRVYHARLERDWIPGRHAGYQARGSWYVLGETIQRLVGGPLAQWIRGHVTDPAAMDDTWLELPSDVFDEYGLRMARLYDTSEPEAAVEEVFSGRVAAAVCVPGTSARGPMRDLCRLYQLLSKSDGTLLAPTTIAAMTARQRSGLYDRTFRHRLDWGLGFVLESNQHGADTVPYGYGRHASQRTFGHAGARCVTGFSDPENGLVVALGVNGRLAQSAHVDQFREFLTAIYEDLDLARSDLHDE